MVYAVAETGGEVLEKIGNIFNGENTDQGQIPFQEIQESTQQATATNNDGQENAANSLAPEQNSPMDYSAEFDRLLAISDAVEKEIGLGIEALKQSVGHPFKVQSTIALQLRKKDISK